MPLIPYEYLWDNNFRAFLYVVSLLWCFVGVSVLADAFMAGIEAITSWTSKKQVPRIHVSTGRPVNDNTGKQIVDTVETPVWNEKVACLTLFALGSSAPEILIACLGCAPEFFEDALGPGTVVGSATFNLYVITGLCMCALEVGETRKIEGLTVHAIQAVTSLFAYIWLAICLGDDVVEIWEAFLTFLFFPILVFVVYAADRNWFMGSKVSPEEEQQTDIEAPEGPAGTIAQMNKTGMNHTVSDLTACIIKTTMKVNYLQRRREAIQSSTGNKKKSIFMSSEVKTEEEQNFAALRLAKEEAAGVTTHAVFIWDMVVYYFHRNANVVELHVERLGKIDIKSKVLIKTTDGNVSGGQAFVHVNETLWFQEGETSKTVGIPIKNEYLWGKGAHFFVELHASPEDSQAHINLKFKKTKVQLSNERHASVFTWTEALANFVNTDSHAILYLQRMKDFATPATVTIKSRDGSGVAGTHFTQFEAIVEFEAGASSKQIRVELLGNWSPVDDAESVDFFVDVFEDVEDTGHEKGHQMRVEVSHKNTLSKKAKIDDLEDLDKDVTCLTQFANALSVNGGGDVDESSIMDCIMHYVAVGWKVIAALIPPCHIYGGVPTFFVALGLIGVCSAMISDFASIFGCIVGMTDVVTSISIVALGTSLPDTFASMLAISADETADNAIGNVTGSNSVNVFLGLGLPWIFSSLNWSGGTPSEKWIAIYGPGSVAYANCWGGGCLNGVSKGLDGVPKGWDNYKDTGAFVVQSGKLGPSLILYAVLTVIAFSFITSRRLLFGAEIGGKSTLGNYFSAAFLISLWVCYLLLVSLQDFGYGLLDSLML